MKLVPFEQWVKKKIEEEGYTEIISYVGIRADEPERDGFLTNNVTEEFITIKMPFREDGLNRQDILNILQQADLYSDDEEVKAFREVKLGCNGIEQMLPEELLFGHVDWHQYGASSFALNGATILAANGTTPFAPNRST